MLDLAKRKVQRRSLRLRGNSQVSLTSFHCSTLVSHVWNISFDCRRRIVTNLKEPGFVVLGSYAFPQMHRFKTTCFAGRALWQTPGVRGLWVKDGDLHPGEIIEVCSSPQASEGHGEWEDLIGHFWGGLRPPEKGGDDGRSSHTKKAFHLGSHTSRYCKYDSVCAVCF